MELLIILLGLVLTVRVLSAFGLILVFISGVLLLTHHLGLADKVFSYTFFVLVALTITYLRELYAKNS